MPFQKGHGWLGGGVKKGFQPTEVHKKHLSAAKLGDKNPAWKGKHAKYRALHMWVKSHLGEAKKCKHCGKLKTTPKSIHWANKSHKYLRKLNDWIPLCVPCHKIYDGYTGGTN